MASLTYSLAGFVIAGRSTVRWSSLGFRAAETRMLVSMNQAERNHLRFVFLDAGCLDNLVNPARAEPVGAFMLGFLSDQLEHFRLGSSESDVVPDAQQHLLECRAFRSPKTGAHPQRGARACQN
jgi:hypothetical protein